MQQLSLLSIFISACGSAVLSCIACLLDCSSIHSPMFLFVGLASLHIPLCLPSPTTVSQVSICWLGRKLMTVAKQQHAKECERQHHSEGVLMEELGRLLGEFKASARCACICVRQHISKLLVTCVLCVKCSSTSDESGTAVSVPWQLAAVCKSAICKFATCLLGRHACSGEAGKQK